MGRSNQSIGLASPSPICELTGLRLCISSIEVCAVLNEGRRAAKFFASAIRGAVGRQRFGVGG